MRKALAALIRARRLSRGLTQADLAEIVGVAYRSMRSYEGAERLAPLDVLIRIAHACDSSLSPFLSALDGVTMPLRTPRKLRRAE